MHHRFSFVIIYLSILDLQSVNPMKKDTNQINLIKPTEGLVTCFKRLLFGRPQETIVVQVEAAWSAALARHRSNRDTNGDQLSST